MSQKFFWFFFPNNFAFYKSNHWKQGKQFETLVHFPTWFTWACWVREFRWLWRLICVQWGVIPSTRLNSMWIIIDEQILKLHVDGSNSNVMRIYDGNTYDACVERCVYALLVFYSPKIEISEFFSETKNKMSPPQKKHHTQWSWMTLECFH